ncbi:MAG: RsmE family RNA methyltransferase [candidate division Zixibacteria bacterium]|nr:RsmE family RNA methyltransferase [candidate division Zixibacteria bacterium]
MEIKSTYFIVEPEDVNGDRFDIKGEEAKHLAKVMRVSKGDMFYAIDGKGLRYRAVVDTVGREKVKVIVLNTARNINEPMCHITLAVPLMKSNIMDYALEKATECGVYKFLPYVSENTVVETPQGASLTRKMNRWKKIIRAAVKQSLRCRLPAIKAPVTFEQIIRNQDDYKAALLADLGRESVNISDIELKGETSRFLLAVGPEAGFTPAEVIDARRAGFYPVKFGERRLRAETACAFFPLLLQYAIGELS